MLENIRLSFQGIWSHKMRSFLTMLGIIIGIASIISIVSTIKGTNEQIKESLIGAGNNSIQIELYQGDSTYWMDQGAPQGVSAPDKNVLDEVLALPEVKSASFYNKRDYADSVYYKNTSLDGGKLLGVDQNYLNAAGYDICAGRGFAESDYKNFKKVAVLDEKAASSLFQRENPIGKTIELGGEPFTVVGVAKASESFEPVINSWNDYYTYYGEQMSGFVLVPTSSWAILYGFDEAQNMVLQANSTEEMSNAGRKAAEILNSNLITDQEQFKYKAQDALEKAKNLQKLSASTNNQLLWIASISLLVGGIGVMNIMLVSVTERTSEIGLKKAIGARKRTILGQFLTEAAVLTSLGGLIGVAAGNVLAKVISKISGTPAAISVPAIIGSVAFSMLIGIIFGLLPSIKAANLNPIDALRHE